MATEVIGHGSKLQLGDGAPTTEVFQEIKGTTQITFGSSKLDTPETTNMGSTGITRTYGTGLRTPGDVTAKINYIPGDASQQALSLAAQAGLKHNFKVILPAVSLTRAFNASIVSFDLDVPDDKIPTYSLKLTLTGDYTETFA